MKRNAGPRDRVVPPADAPATLASAIPLAPGRRARATMTAVPALLLLVALLGLQRGLRVIVESDGVAIVLVLLAAVTVAGPFWSLGSDRGRRR